MVLVFNEDQTLIQITFITYPEVFLLPKRGTFLLILSITRLYFSKMWFSSVISPGPNHNKDTSRPGWEGAVRPNHNEEAG